MRSPASKCRSRSSSAAEDRIIPPDQIRAPAGHDRQDRHRRGRPYSAHGKVGRGQRRLGQALGLTGSAGSSPRLVRPCLAMRAGRQSCLNVQPLQSYRLPGLFEGVETCWARIFLNWRASRPRRSAAPFLRRITDLFYDGVTERNVSENALFEEVVLRVLKDVDVAGRVGLSESVADNAALVAPYRRHARCRRHRRGAPGAGALAGAGRCGSGAL